jgi:hypothetical protein
MINPNEIAERYFASVRARDIEAFMALFATNATFTLPDGRVLSGLDDIRKMESETFERGAPYPLPTAIVSSRNAIAVQVDVRVPSGSILKMANFYRLDEAGLIRSLSVYRQQTPAP